MPKDRTFGFIISTLVAIFALSQVRYDESKILQRRLDVEAQKFFDNPSISTCAHFESGDTLVGHWLVSRIKNGSAPGVTCQIDVATEKTVRAGFVTEWRLKVDVKSSSQVLATTQWNTEFPKAVAFLPVVMFFLACIWKIQFWSVGATLITLLLFLSGMDLIGAVEGLTKATLRSFLDLNLIGFWLLLWWTHLYGLRPSKEESTGILRVFSFVGNLVGSLWNPVAGSLPFSLHSIPKTRGLSNLLLWNSLVVPLSLYFVYLSSKGLSWKLFEFPRYFTFSLLLWMGLRYFRPLRKITSTVAESKPSKNFACVVMICLFLHLFRPLHEIPVVFLVALILLGLEGFGRSRLDFTTSLMGASFSWLRLLPCSLVPLFLLESGVLDVCLSMMEPISKPTTLAFGLLVTGTVVGLISGDISTAFFLLVPLIPSTGSEAICRAALIDGLAIGYLLSPYSIFNVFASGTYQVSVVSVIRSRFHQLRVPIVIGATVYLTGLVPMVSILRPVTFIFLCCLVVAWQLSRRQWKIGRLLPIQRNEAH